VHPRVSRHRSKSRSVHISRLTLPSSGPAFGGPLKSNVRRLWSRRTRSSVQGWVTSLSQRHLALRSSPTRTQLLLSPRVAGHGRLGPSVPLRWRPAHSILSAVSLQSRSALRSQACACHASKDRWLHPCGLGSSGSVSRHFTQLPVSQCLKPQSSMPKRFCTSSFASAAQHICRSLGSQGRRTSSRFSSSKQGRVGSQQPPNPSFKRTCLRHAA